MGSLVTVVGLVLAVATAILKAADVGMVADIQAVLPHLEVALRS